MSNQLHIVTFGLHIISSFCINFLDEWDVRSYARTPSLSLPPNSETCKVFEYLHLNVHVLKIHSPTMVCDLEWFPAYKYIFKYEMYIFEAKPFKKKPLRHHLKNSRDIHPHSSNTRTNFHVPHLNLVICSCKSPGFSNPYTQYGFGQTNPYTHSLLDA